MSTSTSDQPQPTPTEESSTGTAGDTTGTGTAADESSSSGGLTPGFLRFVTELRDPESLDVACAYYEISDGELSEPVLLFGEEPLYARTGLMLFNDAETSMVVGRGDYPRPDYVVDFSDGLPTPPQPLAELPGLEGATTGPVFWRGTPQRLVIAAESSDEPARLVATQVSNGGLEPPVLLAEANLGSEIGLHFVSSDQAWIGFTAVSSSDVGELFLAPFQTPDPKGAVQISDVGVPGFRTSAPQFRDDVVTYFVSEHEAASPGFSALYVVDLSGPTPSAPVRVDEPSILGPNDIQTEVRTAPDGRGVAYWVGEEPGDDPPVHGGMGNIVFVPLTGASPGSPRVLSTPGPDAWRYDSFVRWSPDSRWYYYRAEHEEAGTANLYLVDTANGDLAPPARVTDLIPDGELDYVTVDDESHWLYFVAQQDSVEASLYRVDISGAEVGEPQPIMVDANVRYRLVFSDDGASLLFVADSEGHQHLHRVGIDGSSPGQPEVLSASLDEGVDVDTEFAMSNDGRFVVYRETGPTYDAPEPLTVVDLETGTVYPVADDVNFVRLLQSRKNLTGRGASVRAMH